MGVTVLLVVIIISVFLIIGCATKNKVILKTSFMVLGLSIIAILFFIFILLPSM